MIESHPALHRHKRGARKAGAAGRAAVDSEAFGALIMVGLVAYGVVHLLMAWIVLTIAWGGGGSQASAQGAFTELASTGVGAALLWVTAVGLLVLGVWQLAEALLGHRGKENERSRLFARLGSAGKAIVYVVLAISAATTAAGSASGGDSEKTWTARLMSVPAGRVLVVVIGLGILAIAIGIAIRGVTKAFTNNLAGSVRTGLIRLGQIGYVTKGFAYSIVGVLFVVSAITYDPQKAGGLDDAIRILRQQVYGPALLTIVALGLASFGVYCFSWSRHAARL
ncbi:MAG: DUF1206 domain-containing protein [Nakamurella sp.]